MHRSPASRDSRRAAIVAPVKERDERADCPVPRRAGAPARRWRRWGRIVLFALLVGASVHIPAYLVLRKSHVLLRTGWVRHHCDRSDTDPWGWRDVSVHSNGPFVSRRPPVGTALNALFLPERVAEMWFRSRFESCCSFIEGDACDGSPPSWWKSPPHDPDPDE